MWIYSKVLPASRDIHGRQQSAIRVLPNPFHNQVRLLKLWVASLSLASASATRYFATVAA